MQTEIDKKVLSIESLHKRYSGKQNGIDALREINLSVLEGEVVSIIGSSGCGKTSLLRIIAGLTEPSRGKVIFESTDSNDFRSNGNIGFVFQKPMLFPWRTVIENIVLPNEITGKLDHKTALLKAKSLITTLQLNDFENAYPSSLSGGMLQRATLARALISDPSLLLLDEPFSALDELTRERLWIEFSKLWKERNLSVLLVTHSIREAVFLSDRIIIMSKRPGEIIEEFIPYDKRPREIDSQYSHNFSKMCEKIRAKMSKTL